jgi:hypothetical protein
MMQNPDAEKIFSKALGGRGGQSLLLGEELSNERE